MALRSHLLPSAKALAPECCLCLVLQGPVIPLLDLLLSCFHSSSAHPSSKAHPGSPTLHPQCPRFSLKQWSSWGFLLCSLKKCWLPVMTSPPRTTKRRTTTNLKTKSNHNFQKIKLYGSTTTKELKEKHSSRPVGGADTGSRGGEYLQQGRRGSGWQSERSHICMKINQEEQLGNKEDHTTQGSSLGK